MNFKEIRVYLLAGHPASLNIGVGNIPMPATVH